MSKEEIKNYRFKVGALTLLTTSLGVAGVAQTIHADVTASDESTNSPAETQATVPNINADSSASHLQVSTQSAQSTAPTVSAVQAPAVSAVAQTPQASVAASSTVAAESGNQQGTTYRQTQAVNATTQSATADRVSAAPASAAAVSAVSAVSSLDSAQVTKPESVSPTTKVNSVHVSAPTISTANNGTPSLKFNGIVNTSQSETAANQKSNSDQSSAPTAQPVQSVSVSASQTPKFTLAATNLNDSDTQPVVGNEKNPLTNRDGQTDLSMVRVADVAKVTPATNLVASTTPSALGKQVVSGLNAHTIGQNVVSTVAQADSALPTSTGYAALNQDQLGQTVKTNLANLTNPVQTTNLGDVSDAEFNQAAAKAVQTYKSTGVPQVVTRSAAVTPNESGTTTDDAATNSVANLLDPTGVQRAANQIANPEVTKVATTDSSNLLGTTGTQLQSQLKTDLAAKPTATATALNSSDLTTVKPTSIVVGGSTGTSVPLAGQIANGVAKLADLLNPKTLMNSLSDMLGTLTTTVKNGLSSAVTTGKNLLSNTLKALDPSNIGTALQNFVTSLTKSGPLADIAKAVQDAAKKVTENNPVSQLITSFQNGSIAKTLTNAADSFKTFLSSSNLQQIGNSLADAVSKLGNNAITKGLASGIKSVFSTLANGATGLQTIAGQVSDAVKGLVAPNGVLSSIISAVQNNKNPLSAFLNTTKNAFNNLTTSVDDVVSDLKAGKLTDAQADAAIQKIQSDVKNALSGSDSTTVLADSFAAVPATGTTGTSTTTSNSSNPLDGILNWAKGLISGLTSSSSSNPLSGVVDWVKNLVNGLTSGSSSNPISGVIDWVKKVISSLGSNSSSNPLSGIIDWAKNLINGNGNPANSLSATFNNIWNTITAATKGLDPASILNDLVHLIKWPSANTIPNLIKNIEKIVVQQLDLFGIPGIGKLLNQGEGMSTESGSTLDVVTNLKNNINNSILGTLIGTITNKQSRAKATITWVDPNATDRDKYLRKDGKLTTTLNPNYGKKLFPKGINDPAYVAEDTGISSDPTLQKEYGVNESFKVSDMLNQDHSATMPEKGSWELDGPDEMTPDHRYLTSIRILPENTGLAAIGNLAGSTTSMDIVPFNLLGQGTVSSLASSDSQPLKDGINCRGWIPILGFDNAVGYVAGPLQGGTWHTPYIDRINGNYGVWARIKYPHNTDARAMAEAVDWWSAVNMQQYTVSAALGIIPVTLSDWSLEWMPRYTSWSPNDPDCLYFLARGKKVEGADWNKIEHVDNVGGANIQETINAVLHPDNPLDVLNALKNFTVLSPQSDPIDGKNVPNGALGLWNTTSLLLAAWNQIPIFAELGVLWGVGNFSYNTHVDRYTGNYSSKEIAEILQAQGKIKNADDAAEVSAYETAHPEDFYGADDSEGKSFTRGTVPPTPNGLLGGQYEAIGAFGYDRDPKNDNMTDVANAAIRVPQRALATMVPVSNGMRTWHDYVVVNSGESIKLNRATDGSLTDQSDGGRTMALYGKANPTASDTPIFQIKNFFTKEKQADGTMGDADVTDSYVKNGLKTITISTNASKASGNLGPNGKPAVTPISNLDADPGDLKAGTTNVYDNVIHINGTAIDGSAFLKTGDVPIEQTVNGAKLLNQAPNGANVSASSTFNLSGRTRSNELKKGNTVTLQYKVDEIDNDGKVINAGKWTAFPDKSGTVNVNNNDWSNFKLPMGSLNLQNGHKYRISYQATDAYGFKTNANVPTTMTVGLKSGYSFAYQSNTGTVIAPTKFVASTDASDQVDLDANKTAINGYVLTSILVNGIPHGLTEGTVTVTPATTPVITYIYKKE